MTNVLELRRITKSSAFANDGIDMTLEQGEIHAPLGRTAPASPPDEYPVRPARRTMVKS
jgi:hypothetical protein